MATEFSLGAAESQSAATEMGSSTATLVALLKWAPPLCLSGSAEMGSSAAMFLTTLIRSF